MFIDFKIAFYTVWRKALWKLIIRHIGVSGKIINLNTKFCVTINAKLTEWFCELVGLRQRCLLLLILFDILLEFIEQEMQSMSDEFQFTDENLTASVKYADDTILISLIFEKLQLSTAA